MCDNREVSNIRKISQLTFSLHHSVNFYSLHSTTCLHPVIIEIIKKIYIAEYFKIKRKIAVSNQPFLAERSINVCSIP